MQYELSDLDFQTISGYIYDKLGIYYGKEKREMLSSKINRVMYKNGFKESSEIISVITSESDTRILHEFINEITTHTTNFFREANHFEFIKDMQEFLKKSNKRIMQNREIRVWSAGCSTGEEPYTIAMTLFGLLGKSYKIKILATDVSKKVLETAQAGIYGEEIEKQVSKEHLSQFFKKKDQLYFVNQEIKDLVFFRYFNLSDPFSFQNQFDLIFCRNVIIYFDFHSRQKLIDKFYQVLIPGGILFLGHSESLSGISNQFKYLNPTVYLKP